MHKKLIHRLHDGMKEAGTLEVNKVSSNIFTLVVLDFFPLKDT